MTRMACSHTALELGSQQGGRFRRRLGGIVAIMAAAMLMVATGVPLGMTAAGATTTIISVCGETDPLSKVVASTYVNDTSLAVSDPYADTSGPSRCPTPDEGTFWRAYLASGHPVSDFTYQMNKTYLAPFLVRFAYARVLEREADPGGLSHWTTYMKKTGDFMTMMADMVASQEYIAHAGSTAGYITAAYDLFTFHDPDPAGLSFWTVYLTGGGSPSALTHALIKRPEAMDIAVEAAYAFTFNREPDQSSADYWSTVLQHFHGNMLKVMAHISNSAEYYNYCQNGFP